MARIELVNICKTFREPGPPGSADILVPALALAQAMTRLVSPTGGPRRPFAIRNLDLTIADGETMVVLGPSGCGKSTLLRIIAGLMDPDSGEVRYDGVDMARVPPGDRRIGMVFQNYALYPHLRSKTNILSYFFFRKRSPELEAEAAAKYRRTSELMGVDIAYLQDRMPTNLSGGERQRVALGRCITRDPALFLLDEPFSNLDQQLREKYRVSLKILLRQFNITTVYVTHDQHEALVLADRLAIMNEGSIEQVGKYEEIYCAPRNAFVAGFLNPHVDTPAINLIDGGIVSYALGHGTVGVRPEDVEVLREEREGAIRGTVSNRIVLPMRDTTILTVRVGQHEVYARTRVPQELAPGDQVWLLFRAYHLFDKASGVRLRSHPAR